jgi:hypothetical protein
VLGEERPYRFVPVPPARPVLRAASAGSGTPVTAARVKSLHSARPIRGLLSDVALRSRPLHPRTAAKEGKHPCRKGRALRPSLVPAFTKCGHFVNFPRACAPSAPAPPPAALRTARRPPRGPPARAETLRHAPCSGKAPAVAHVTDETASLMIDITAA